jgi:tetratricopeptide (TPR) repeat protein
MHMVLIFALIAAAGAGSARAALISSTGGAESEFARGVEEYESGQFAEAQRAFGDAARLERRAPDAWANLGTAAWAAGDTARAVQGWMRALALEPSAGDARDRLGLTPAGRDLEWRVPRASPDMLLAAGALLWLAGWGWLAYRLHKRRRVDGPAILGICVAVVLFAMIRPLDQRLAARDRAVVSSDTPVRSAPRLSTQRSSVARTGEVVKVLGRDGVWAHVAIEDSRGGWLPSSVLLSLERD